MPYLYCNSWENAYSLIDYKWYVYQYMRISKMYHQQGEKYDEKNKKEQKWQDSPRQDLNPDHGPQHGAVRCSTHWAAGYLSTSQAEV